MQDFVILFLGKMKTLFLFMHFYINEIIHGIVYFLVSMMFTTILWGGGEYISKHYKRPYSYKAMGIWGIFIIIMTAVLMFFAFLDGSLVLPS